MRILLGTWAFQQPIRAVVTWLSFMGATTFLFMGLWPYTNCSLLMGCLFNLYYLGRNYDHGK
jgi:hypothetical protein